MTTVPPELLLEELVTIVTDIRDILLGTYDGTDPGPRICGEQRDPSDGPCRLAYNHDGACNHDPATEIATTESALAGMKAVAEIITADAYALNDTQRAALAAVDDDLGPICAAFRLKGDASTTQSIIDQYPCILAPDHGGDHEDAAMDRWPRSTD